MERELFICSCENTEHQIVFSWFEDEYGSDVYATIHLRKRSFWERLKYGIRYIFGYQCRYGAFDEFIFNPADADKLKKIYQFLSDTHEDKVMGEKMESVARIEKAYKEGRLPVAIKSHCGLDGTIRGEIVRRNANTETNPVNMLNGNIAEQTANT